MKNYFIEIKLKNILNKILLIVCFGVFIIISGLFFNGESNNISRNQIEKVSAAEEKPLVCRKQTEVQLPFGITANLGPNEFEIPIGEVTDMTESIAERVMAEMQKIIDASILEAAAAGQMTDLSGQCGISRCTTPGCNEYSCNPHDCNPQPCESGVGTCYDTCWETCCNKPSCGGQACPDGIGNQLQEVIRQANFVATAYNEIRGILIDWHPKKPVGYWWLPGCIEKGFGVPGCLTEKEFILKELERARSGDYEILGGWERRPPGLNDCVIRPQDIEEVLRGEKTGKYLFSCKEAVAAGVIESKDCYGYNEATEALRQQAENYYCCEQQQQAKLVVANKNNY